MKDKKFAKKLKKIHINQDKNNAFFDKGDIIKIDFLNGATVKGKITCISIKKEGNELHTVIDLKHKNENGESVQISYWLENIKNLEIIRFKGEKKSQ